MGSKHKIGDLVRVRDDAGTLHSYNTQHQGQLGIVKDVEDSPSKWPLYVQMLSSNIIAQFNDEELDDDPQ